MDQRRGSRRRAPACAWPGGLPLPHVLSFSHPSEPLPHAARALRVPVSERPAPCERPASRHPRRVGAVAVDLRLWPRAIHGPLPGRGRPGRSGVDNKAFRPTYGTPVKPGSRRTLYENGVCHHSLHLPKGELGSCPPSGAGPARLDGWSPIRSVQK